MLAQRIHAGMVETHAIGSLQRYAEDREIQNESKHFFLAVGMQSAPSSSPAC